MSGMHAAYRAALSVAVVGSVLTGVVGTLVSAYFCMWTASDLGIPPFVVLSGALVTGVVLLWDAVRPGRSRVTAGPVAIFVGLAVASAALIRTGEPFLLVSFAAPTFGFALVVPLALVGRRDLGAASTSLWHVGLGFVVAAVIQELSGLGLWVGLLDAMGALATGMLGALLAAAQALRTRSPQQHPGGVAATTH